MNNFDFSLYDLEDETPFKESKKAIVEKPISFDFEEYEPEEVKEEIPKEESNFSLRTALQVPLGALEATTPGIIANVINLVGMGEALDPEEIEHIKKISEREGIPFNEEKYLEAVKGTSEAFPTIGNIAKGIESKTGIPLEPKTKLQQGVNIASGIASQPLKALTQVKKPSGMTTKGFEKLKTPINVSEKKFAKITDAIESDFKKISDEIASQSPISKVKGELKENPLYKQEIANKFKDVENQSLKIPDKFKTEEVTKKLLTPKKEKGFLPSEYETDYNNFMKDFVKKTEKKEIRASDLVHQYRLNNKQLSEAFDPSRTKAFNRAKKDALLDYNKAIGETIEERFPNSEFSNLFKETNKKWSEISDVQAMDSFVDSLFDGKIKFKKVDKFFQNENLARPFKRGLGEKGFEEFKTLLNDLTSTQNPYNMLKVAKSKGFEDLAKIGGSFLLHPNIGKAKLGYETAKKTWKFFTNLMLDKPQLTLNLKNAVKSLKKGNFEESEKEFKFIDSQMKEVQED